MPQFVSGPKPSKDKIILGSTEDLLKWITSVVSKDWSVAVYENLGVENTRAGRVRKFTRFAVHVSIGRPYFVDVASAETLVALAKRFQSDLWPKIVAENLKREKGQAVKATAVPLQDVIEVRQPRLPHRQGALPGVQQRALTHKPAGLPAPETSGSLFKDDE